MILFLKFPAFAAPYEAPSQIYVVDRIQMVAAGLPVVAVQRRVTNKTPFEFLDSLITTLSKQHSWQASKA